MKQKNSDIVIYIFLSVVAVIIVGMIIAFIRNSLESTMDTANHIISRQEQTISEIEEYDIMKYDNEELRGSEVINFIKKYLGDYSAEEEAPIYVRVKTKSVEGSHDNTYTNSEHILDIKNFSNQQHYIKPTAWFTAEVIRTENKAILGVAFMQK
ncbi:MAG: hypothetical protein GX757_06295 [Clostridiales bacterium]|nr:hypothetical protein [Clostridiales bacterium]